MTPFHDPPLHDRPGRWVGLHVGHPKACDAPRLPARPAMARATGACIWTADMPRGRHLASWTTWTTCAPAQPLLVALRKSTCKWSARWRQPVGLRCTCPGEIAWFRQNKRPQRPRFQGFQHAPQVRFLKAVQFTHCVHARHRRPARSRSPVASPLG